MRPVYLLGLLLLLAACGKQADAVQERLAARRTALGLPPDPLTFEDAMRAMEEARYETVLARVGSRRLSREEVLDTALQVESLLARAEPPAGRPPRFAGLLGVSRQAALELARAAAGDGPLEKPAYALIASCLDCHREFREEEH